MDVALDHSRDRVFIPTHEEGQRLRMRTIFHVDIQFRFARMQRINEWPHMPTAGSVTQVRTHRSSVWQFTVLALRIVRRKEAGEQHDRMNREQHRRRYPQLRARGHRSSRTRGSANSSNRSAVRFPPTSSTVENTTAPITT